MTKLTKAEQLANRLIQAAPLSMILIADTCATELLRLSPMEARVKELESELRECLNLLACVDTCSRNNFQNLALERIEAINKLINKVETK